MVLVDLICKLKHVSILDKNVRFKIWPTHFLSAEICWLGVASDPIAKSYGNGNDYFKEILATSAVSNSAYHEEDWRTKTSCTSNKILQHDFYYKQKQF